MYDCRQLLAAAAAAAALSTGCVQHSSVRIILLQLCALARFYSRDDKRNIIHYSSLSTEHTFHRVLGLIACTCYRLLHPSSGGGDDDDVFGDVITLDVNTWTWQHVKVRYTHCTALL